MKSISKPDQDHVHVDDVETEALSSDFNPAEERKVVWKCDLHVVPILMLLYLLAFLDRINIGNARLQGLEDDLRMKGGQYNYALFIFFIPYILCEVPCNLIMKKLAPSTWLSGIMVAWGRWNVPPWSTEFRVDHFGTLGCVTVGQGFVQSWSALMACRFLLGIFEAGFLPGKSNPRRTHQPGH